MTRRILFKGILGAVGALFLKSEERQDIEDSLKEPEGITFYMDGKKVSPSDAMYNYEEWQKQHCFGWWRDNIFTKACQQKGSKLRKC